MSFASLPRPIAIAHRAGNHLPMLRRAVNAGADIVEADVWFYRGRLEVRHLKTAGPLPFFWDRWRLAWSWERQLRLDELLAAAGNGVSLMLDLKGMDRRLPSELVNAAKAAGTERVSVCARNWRLLDALSDYPEIAVVHSIGSSRELRTIWPRLEPDANDAVSIHRRFVSPETVRMLKEKVSTVMTWPINDRAWLDRVTAAGVDGVISDSLDLVREITSARDRPGALAGG